MVCTADFDFTSWPAWYVNYDQWPSSTAKLCPFECFYVHIQSYFCFNTKISFILCGFRMYLVIRRLCDEVKLQFAGYQCVRTELNPLFYCLDMRITFGKLRDFNYVQCTMQRSEQFKRIDFLNWQLIATVRSDFPSDLEVWIRLQYVANISCMYACSYQFNLMKMYWSAR